MLKEIFQYISTPCQPYVKKLGFLTETIGMEARYQRCQTEWDSHYKQCQLAIVQAASKVANKNTIVVMGAGSLREIPLEQLSQDFIHVVLVDLVFLNRVKKIASFYQNVSLVEADVSNSLEELLTQSDCKKLIKYLVSNPPVLSDILPNIQEVNCIISLNLITQIPLIPVSRFIHKFNSDIVLVDELARLLIQQHLALLKSAADKKCLISDREICEYDAKKVLLDVIDPTWGIEFPQSELSWQWQSVPLYESSQKIKKIHTVGVSFLSPP